MRIFILLLLVVPWLALAAPADMSAERQYSQFLIGQAYLKYPAIPAGLLESQAWAATRWQHRIPATDAQHTGVPPVYGLFGLYGTNAGGFVDLLGAVATHAGLTREELMAGQDVYVDAVAGFIAAKINALGLAGQPLEAMRPIAELMSGIEPTSDGTRYAVNSHAYELYRAAGTGLDLGVVQVEARALRLEQVFTAAELEQLRASRLVISAPTGAADEKKKTASFAAGSPAAPEQVNVDYPGAIWNEAYYFSSRNGSPVTHVVVHTMQGSYAGSIAWFLNADSNVSAHYLMRSTDGQVTQMVRNAEKAWHARSANAYTIGIEHEGFVDNPDWYTDASYEESARLVAYTCDLHGFDCAMAYAGESHDALFELGAEYTVKGHQHYPDQVHTDPGIHWDWPRYHALINGGVTVPATNHLPAASFAWQCTALSCDFDASASTDADGVVVAHDWDFGDGTTGSASTASHTYASGGDYAVVLAVTDDAGAVHTTLRSVRVAAAPVPTPQAPRQSSGGGVTGPWLLLMLLLCVGCTRASEQRLEMPPLAQVDYHSIAARIYANETNSKLRYLTHWNVGEDFPSLGIGHFIWFPAGVDAPFDESFPAMLAYLREHENPCTPVPEWLAGPDTPDAPWPDKASFDAARDAVRMVELREWLASSAPQQARYIVASFNARWNALELEEGDKATLTDLLQRLLATPRGLFAVIDYYNFKGLGSNPRERYAGEGWGLVQVLRDIAPRAAQPGADLVDLFSRATADRLALRVANSAPERNEARWLEGWHRRVAAYRDGAPAVAHEAETVYRVTPYLQAVSATEATIAWFAAQDAQAEVIVAAADLTVTQAEPRLACELAYHLAEFADLDRAYLPPWRHTARLEGLEAGREYAVTVTQDGNAATLRLRTPNADSAHFVVYGDSETEPESRGTPSAWPAPLTGAARDYLVDQDRGYAANLALIASKSPDFVAIAGDLVESGGEQRDWDEFWSHNAALAASMPLVTARGNHDYYGGPGDLGGYRESGARRALAKYEAYFGRPPYYAVEHGPVTLLVLDGNNDYPERSVHDTNWYLDGAAPGLRPGSAQWQWLETELAKAQRDKAFTFVMLHAAPYSSGIHGRPPGLGAGENFSSGQPLQALTPLLLRYGVDAVFSGHDEMYERSVVSGVEVRPDGRETAHRVQFYTVGIGGDGLRGPDTLAQNPASVFVANRDAPETWSADGVLLDGGRHYGHLDVRVGRSEEGRWQARIEPVYVFPLIKDDGKVESFEPRRYDDVVVLEAMHDD